MKTLFATVLLALALSAPAFASVGYFIVSNNQVIAGPYATFMACARVLTVYNIPGAFCQPRAF
jgi:hypothetical protein